jgi:hypothetical protein
LRLWVYLRSIEVVTIKLSVARFEKAAGHDSLNVNVAEVGNRLANRPSDFSKFRRKAELIKGQNQPWIV